MGTNAGLHPGGSSIARGREEAVLVELLQGAWVTQAIHAAAHLGLADLMRYGARSAADLAEATGTHPQALLRLLRALAAAGVFEEAREDYYSLTPLSQLLRTDVPQSLHAVALAAGEAWATRPWEELLLGLHGGASAFERAMGCGPEEFFAAHEEADRLNRRAATCLSRHAAEAMLATYDYSWARSIVEIRAGKGSIVTSLLRGNTQAHALVVDQPHEIQAVIDHVVSRGLQDRCEVVAGDMLEGLPRGGDLYLLRQVVGDLDDDQALRLLGHCRSAMVATGRVVVVEALVDGVDAALARLADLDMMVGGRRGRLRGHAEVCHLLEEAGFDVTNFMPTGTPYGVFEGCPSSSASHPSRH